jgi:hypothetical protein
VQIQGTGAYKTMADKTNPLSEVLHSENHSKLSAEQIAKAVARHNRDHSGAAKNGSPKPKKVTKAK